jgi:hypothetical protein
VGEEAGKEEGGEREGREALSEGSPQEACPGGERGRVREVEEWEGGWMHEKGKELLRSSLQMAQELQDLIGESNILEVMGRHELCRGQVWRWGLGTLVELSLSLSLSPSPSLPPSLSTLLQCCTLRSGL